MLELNENEAPVVKRAFELFIEGEGAKNIAQRLNADGFRTRQGRLWGKCVILYMLKNEMYTGTFIWNRYNKSNGGKVLNAESEQIRIPNHHTALVEQTCFDKIQRLLAERTPKQIHPRVVASKHLLNGLVFCSHCGSQAVIMPDVAPRLRELNASKEALLAEKAKCEATARRPVPTMPAIEVVKGYVNDLRDTLREGSIMQQKAFLRSFIKRIGVKDDLAEIEYTCPMGLSGEGRQEVLSIGKNGSKGRTRTYYRGVLDIATCCVLCAIHASTYTR